MGVKNLVGLYFFLFVSFNLMAHGDADILITEIDIQLEEDPNNAALYFNRGVLYQGQDHYNEAFLDYQKVKTLEPSNIFVDHNLAQLCYEHQFNRLALTYIQSYIENNPDNIKGYITRGQIYRALQQYDDAIDDFNHAIENEYSTPEYYNELVATILEADTTNYDLAISYYRLALDKFGKLTSFSEKIIQLEIDRNNFTNALVEIESLIQTSERKEKWHLLKGDLLMLLEDPKGAEIAYLSAQEAINKLSPARKNTDYSKELIAQIERSLTQIHSVETSKQ